MKVSLIMPTINRHDELIIFLESLEKQTYKNFELIIVDQNLDGYIFDIIEDFQEKIDLKYKFRGHFYLTNKKIYVILEFIYNIS